VVHHIRIICHWAVPPVPVPWVRLFAAFFQYIQPVAAGTLLPPWPTHRALAGALPEPGSQRV